jgi:glutathione S-transferase
MTTTLYGWGPLFDLPSPSPFVMKTEIQLQMLGVPFERAIADLDAVSKHKAPYVRDDGVLVEDSTFIRAHFERKLNKDLDAGLSAEERATAWALERLLEDRLNFIMGHERWLEGQNFERGPRLFFMGVPEAIRAKVCDDVRSEFKAMLVRHGIGRHSRAERMELAARDIAAVAAILGDKPFLFGDQPTAVDAVAFGELASCGTAYFDSPLVGIVDKHPSLRRYLARMEAKYFAPGRWPAMGGR